MLPHDESSSFFVGLVGRLEAFRIVFVVSLFLLELAIMLFGILLHFAFITMTYEKYKPKKKLLTAIV